MNPVRKALTDALRGDEQLKKLAMGGVHHRIAESGSPPFVIFHKADGHPLWAFDGPAMDKDVWVVKGVGERAVAEDIDKRCKELLNGATLAIEDKVHQDLRAISDVDYDEIVNGERINHVGAEYKLDSEDE